MEEKNISHQMLRGARRPIVIALKAVFEQAIIVYADGLPEPTMDNLLKPNSKVLLGRRDKFRKYFTNSSKKRLMEAVWKIFIDEVEHDPAYRYPWEWLVEEMVEETLQGRLTPRPLGHPISYWEEPKPYGMNIGRKVKEFALPYKEDA